MGFRWPSPFSAIFTAERHQRIWMNTPLSLNRCLRSCDWANMIQFWLKFASDLTNIVQFICCMARWNNMLLLHHIISRHDQISEWDNLVSDVILHRHAFYIYQSLWMWSIKCMPKQRQSCMKCYPPTFYYKKTELFLSWILIMRLITTCLTAICLEQLQRQGNWIPHGSVKRLPKSVTLLYFTQNGFNVTQTNSGDV